MVLWWIGNIIFIAVVIPAVLFFLNLVLRQILEVKSYADDVLEHGVALTATFDSVSNLTTTRELARATRENVSRYGAVVEQLL